jgi:hypothetical protein
VKVVGVFRIGHEWPAPTDGALEHERHALSKHHSFGAMQSEIRQAIVSTDSADRVQASANYVCARARDRFDTGRRILEEVVCLGSRVLQLQSYSLVERGGEKCRTREETRENRVLMGEKRSLFLRVRRVPYGVGW